MWLDTVNQREGVEDEVRGVMQNLIMKDHAVVLTFTLSEKKNSCRILNRRDKHYDLYFQKDPLTIN